MQVGYIFGIWSSLVKFVYQGHQVKVKVIGSKSVSLCPVCGWLGSTEEQFCDYFY